MGSRFGPLRKPCIEPPLTWKIHRIDFAGDHLEKRKCCRISVTGRAHLAPRSMVSLPRTLFWQTSTPVVQAHIHRTSESHRSDSIPFHSFLDLDH
jgi:hypothetical protein